MNKIFSVDFNTARDWRMEELENALKQIDEAREIVLREMKEWKKERAEELEQELYCLLDKISDEGFDLIMDYSHKYILQDNDCPTFTVEVHEDE